MTFPNKKCRIGIISLMQGFKWGGSEELWAASAHEALNQGHDVTLCVFPDPLAPAVEALKARGARVFTRERTVSSSRRLMQRVVRFLAPSRISALLDDPDMFAPFFQAGPYDVVLISQGATYDYAVFPQLHPHLEANPDLRLVALSQFNWDVPSSTDDVFTHARRWVDRFDPFLFVAQRNLETARFHLRHPIANSLVVQNPVNLKERHLEPWPSFEEGLQIACVARLDIVFKGQDMIIRALGEGEALPADEPWTMHFYGSGPNEERLRALVSYYGLEKRVLLHGHVRDVRSIWSKCHLLLLASHGEGTPLSLYEAMLCGRPALVTDAGDMQLVVEHGVTGLHIPAATSRSVATSLRDLWPQRDRLAAMGEAAHHKATSMLSSNPGGDVLNVLLRQSASTK